MLPRLLQQGETMKKKVQNKKMFVMRETLVDLTPHLRQVQVQGGSDCIGVTTAGFDLRNLTKCPYTSVR
jgi:hypothetical protein